MEIHHAAPGWQLAVREVLGALKAQFKGTLLGPWKFEATTVDTKFLVTLRTMDGLGRKSILSGKPHVVAQIRGSLNPKNKWAIPTTAIVFSLELLVSEDGSVILVGHDRKRMTPKEIAEDQERYIQSAEKSQIELVQWQAEALKSGPLFELLERKRLKKQKALEERQKALGAKKIQENYKKLQDSLQDLEQDLNAKAPRTGPWTIKTELRATNDGFSSLGLNLVPNDSKANQYELKNYRIDGNSKSYRVTPAGIWKDTREIQVGIHDYWYGKPNSNVVTPRNIVDDIRQAWSDHILLAELAAERVEEEKNAPPKKKELDLEGLLGAMNSIVQRLGWDWEDAEEEWENTYTASYRSDTIPKESDEVGEYEYDELVNLELARLKKNLGSLDPYKEFIEKISVYAEEKSWVYLSVTLK
jgi:hypothetical protein